MMAGHLIIALFSEVGWHFLFVQLTPLGAPIGVLGVIMTILLTAFELFIQALQAYVFALLAAMFIDERAAPRRALGLSASPPRPSGGHSTGR